jgi:hypothetical protein
MLLRFGQTSTYSVELRLPTHPSCSPEDVRLADGSKDEAVMTAEAKAAPPSVNQGCRRRSSMTARAPRKRTRA